MKRREDRAVAVAAAIAEQMKALNKEAPVISTEARQRGRLELPAIREAALRELVMEICGPGTAHNNNN